VFIPRVGRFSFSKRSLSKLWLVHSSEPHGEVYSNNWRFCFLFASIYFHSWVSLLKIIKFFKQINLYTVLLQEISIIFIGQMPTYLVFKKSIYYAGINIFNSLPPSLTVLKNDKAKFKAALRKYLYTNSFYSVDKIFRRKDDL
jgi:hypothetical protein